MKLVEMTDGELLARLLNEEDNFVERKTVSDLNALPVVGVPKNLSCRTRCVKPNPRARKLVIFGHISSDEMGLIARSARESYTRTPGLRTANRASKV
jgi:hypothetical protein